MKSYFGHYHLSRSAEASDATVLAFDKSLNIGFRNPDGSNAMINWSYRDVELYFDLPSQQTRIRNRRMKGPELYISGDDALHFIREMQEAMQRPWYRKDGSRQWVRNGSLLAGLLGVLFLVYLLLVPWLSQKMASRVSVKTERQLGDAVYDAMGLSDQLDTKRTAVLNDFFSAMQVSTVYDIRISVVNGRTVNAFALPGGHIVVYSALLDQIKTYPELAALLSHEFIHVNNRHTTKSIFRQLGSKIFLGLLFGKLGTVTSVLVDHADNLKSLTYSRRLEKEADLEGLELLARRHIDPKGFDDLFAHLKKAAPENNLPEFLESHPGIDKRIRYISESASGTRVEENLQLKAIFEQLKQQ